MTGRVMKKGPAQPPRRWHSRHAKDQWPLAYGGPESAVYRVRQSRFFSPLLSEEGRSSVRGYAPELRRWVDPLELMKDDRLLACSELPATH